MNDQELSGPGARALASVEHDRDLLHILYAVDLSPAWEELLTVDRVLDGIVLLGEWAIAYPSATSELLSRIARDPQASQKIATVILGCDVVSRRLGSEADEVLAAAFPRLTGPWRDAAADRPGVRKLLGLVEGVGYEAVPEPEPGWQWPIGKPFPAAESIEGAQARLNYLGRGCGPVNGEWNELTRRAVVRWQIDRGMEPTGELDRETVFELEHFTPAAPD